MAPRLSAVILAAGLSSRMGRLKPLLPLGAATVLERCIQLFRQSGIEEVVAVIGHRASEVGAIAERAGARTVCNAGFAAGMYSSIRAGIRHISSRSQGFFLLPVDIPLVRRGTVRLLTQAWATAPASVLYPVFDGQRGHPPLIAAQLGAALTEAKNPEGGLRTLLAGLEAQHPGQVREVPVADANILFDLDSPEDYAVGLQRLAHSGYPTMEECAALLKDVHPLAEEGLAHGHLVAEIAVALCEAFRRRQPSNLNPQLCRAGGLLHDLAKGCPHHEQEGGRWLSDLGFDRVAAIVAAHRDLDWPPGTPITETALVHLADKLALGNRVVDIDTRFAGKRALYRDNPEACRAIDRRYATASQIAAAVEAAVGQRLDSLLSSLPAACRR